MPIIRPYEAERDRDYVLRTWREVGSIEDGDDKEKQAFDPHVSGGGARVVAHPGEARAG